MAVALALALTARVGWADISVSAAVESTDVVVGEPFVLTIVVDGAQNVPVPVVNVPGFHSDYMGPSTQVSFVNGRMSASVTHRYRMIADGPGEYTLGPFTVGYEDKRYTTTPIAMRVQPAGARRRVGAPGGNQALRLVVAPSRSEVYVGERFEVLVTLYVGDIRVRDLQYPVIRADGVTVEKFGQPDQGTEVVDGKRYTTVRLRTRLTPVRSGPIDLRATMSVAVVSGRRGFDSFFDQLLPGDAKQVAIEAEPSRITVLPLPDEGRPPDFTGAVGTYQFDVDAKPTELQVGDPITLRMEIRGSGNLSTVAPPVVPVSPAFRRYDAQPVKGEDGEDRRVFEQVIIPNAVDVHEIPALRFSYFDPDARAYQTIVRGPIAIQVQAAAPGRAAVVDGAPATAPTPAPEAPLGRDIVYIKDAPGPLQARAGGPLRIWWWGLLALPVVLVAGLRAWVRRGELLAADPRRIRFRAAGREAQRALAAARVQAGRERLDAASAALTAYLSAKLDLPPGAVERERVLERLAAGAVAEPTRAEVTRFFQLAEEARYAGGAGAAADGVVQAAERIIAALERERGLEARMVAWLAILLAGALLATPGRAEEGAASAFDAGNQAYAAGRYEDAITAYRRARTEDRESGALEFNLGNAYMKRGDLGRAIASYERAARLLPRDPDVTANLAFARERANLETPPAPIWQRLAAPFAFRATGAELAGAFLALWWILWMVVSARLLWPGARLALGRAATVVGLLATIIGISLVVRVRVLDMPGAAVVVAGGDTPVRFEPTASGTEHFVVTPGEDVTVREERDGWLLVARADGRRGWVQAEVVERVD